MSGQPSPAAGPATREGGAGGASAGLSLPRPRPRQEGPTSNQVITCETLSCRPGLRSPPAFPPPVRHLKGPPGALTSPLSLLVSGDVSELSAACCLLMSPRVSCRRRAPTGPDTDSHRRSCGPARLQLHNPRPRRRQRPLHGSGFPGSSPGGHGAAAHTWVAWPVWFSG